MQVHILPKITFLKRCIQLHEEGQNPFERPSLLYRIAPSIYLFPPLFFNVIFQQGAKNFNYLVKVLNYFFQSFFISYWTFLEIGFSMKMNLNRI